MNSVLMVVCALQGDDSLGTAVRAHVFPGLCFCVVETQNTPNWLLRSAPRTILEFPVSRPDASPPRRNQRGNSGSE